MASPEFLFTRNPNLEDSWPFVHQRMVRRLGELGPTQVLDTDGQTHVHQQVDLSATIGISHLGRNLTDACIDHAPKLRMVGALTDNSGHGIPYSALQDRGIPVIDSTRAWSQSVAECAFGLALSALRRGSLVVVITRAHAVDMEALRERIVRDELAGAFDVYDVEPVPVDDELRNRDNVVHTPHIAGRTKDANIRVADVIADDFARMLEGEAPVAALTPKAVEVRTSPDPDRNQ